MSRALYVEGVALWAPRLPGWDAARAILRGDAPAPDAPAPRPAPDLLAPTERRRAPDTVAIALEVASRACAAAGREPKMLASVFASTHGDLAISDYMCATLADTPKLISPTKFHNSVHNAAAGYWTIGTGCTRPSTALTAWQHTFGAGFVEAAMQVACDSQPVLLVAYDIEAKGPMATVTQSRGLFGVALVLAPEAGANTVARIDWNVGAGQGARNGSHHAALVAGNPLHACLPLFEALALGVPAAVRHSVSDSLALDLEVRPWP